ncbi:DUF4296 domain-containing protein [Algoriphagus sp. D3-2-R+10]|uniref:DUF4296 domain-containing protein n=1 Tax=Algoriphagus aurantiacus TaxID=3103948 RepID=UPI002B37395D|nr:DUF4296 domain-containing protein [Algoriphagus sp. D3-2-R+10]MEB2777304.1 DUF4296 domain-containing protein [Algoriphagus sp. D3-2-R+10]
MKRFLILSFSILALASCGSGNKPEGLLPQDKMVEVLIDIHLTEGLTSAMPVAYDSSIVLYNLLEKDVFVKHEVSDSVFTQSMLYYLRDPAEMEQIYSRVVDSLIVRESSGGTIDQF